MKGLHHVPIVQNKFLYYIFQITRISVEFHLLDRSMTMNFKALVVRVVTKLLHVGQN